MNLRTMAFAAIGTVAFGTSAVSFAQTPPGAQGTPPPPPAPNSGPTSGPLIAPSTPPTALPSSEAPPTSTPATATPAAAESNAPAPGGRRGRRGGSEASPGPSPTDTPEPPQFSTLDGVWEIAFQPLTGARTSYSHLYVTQSGNDLKGTWRRDGKTIIPFTGTFDGRLLKLTATDGKSTFTFSGYEENYMDMVGMFSDGDPAHPGTPFTGAHRKRERDRSVNIQ